MNTYGHNIEWGLSPVQTAMAVERELENALRACRRAAIESLKQKNFRFDLADAECREIESQIKIAYSGQRLFIQCPSRS